MGYLDNTSITVDAILTNKGRQILAAGGQLNITKFALADDEVDYNLWNPAHSLGTNYYGAVIENMPVLEASPDETQMLRYKLVTLPRGAMNIPTVSIQPDGPITLTSLAQSAPIQLSTNVNGANSTLGYTAILSDDTVCTIMAAIGSGASTPTGPTLRASGPSNTTMAAGPTPNTVQGTFANFMADEVGMITSGGNTITVTSINGAFTIKPKAIIGTKSALITFIANETGGFKTIVVTVSNTTSDMIVDMVGPENVG